MNQKPGSHIATYIIVEFVSELCVLYHSVSPLCLTYHHLLSSYNIVAILLLKTHTRTHTKSGIKNAHIITQTISYYIY